MSPLQPPRWVVADVSNSINGGTRIGHVAHAVRGEHTLCGYTERNIRWSTAEVVDAGLCAPCRQVPDGYAVMADMLDLGLTYRQLDHWCRQGYLRPSDATPGSGHRRVFPPDEVRVAALMIRLVTAGLTVDGANRAARNDGWLCADVRVVISSDHHDHGPESDVAQH